MFNDCMKYFTMTQIYKLWNIFLLVIVVLLKGNVVKVDGQEGNDPALQEKFKNEAGATTLGGAGAAANRFTTVLTTVKVKKRTMPKRISLAEDCDYLAYYCMKAYKTGRLCARTIYYLYENFKNYCAMDYVNCMERYEVWQVAYMGSCKNIQIAQDYQHYEYHDDLFLDQIYVIEE